MAIDLMTLDIAAMATRTLANGVVERADVIWHVCSEQCVGRRGVGTYRVP